MIDTCRITGLYYPPLFTSPIPTLNLMTFLFQRRRDWRDSPGGHLGNVWSHSMHSGLFAPYIPRYMTDTNGAWRIPLTIWSLSGFRHGVHHSNGNSSAAPNEPPCDPSLSVHPVTNIYK